MKAKDAINGQLYNLPRLGYHEAYQGAECHGLSYTREWVLFLTFNEWNEREIRMIGLEIEVEPLSL